MKPINRFLVFTACLVALIAIAAFASPSRHGVRASQSMKDMCVCVPTKAALMVKTAIAKAQARSAELVALNAAAGQ
jgi:hypothetical protein